MSRPPRAPAPSRRPLLTALSVLVAALVAGPLLRRTRPHGRFEAPWQAQHFVKANLHTHSSASDGDSPPEAVIAWYRAHGYGLLALTEHQRLTSSEAFAELQDASFKLIAGEEITMTGAGRQVHVNALCTRSVIAGGDFASAREALGHALAEIAAQGGVALVNHPNFDEGVTLDDLAVVPQGALLEIMSGHPYVYSLGTARRPSHEALWDSALVAGHALLPAAVDDTHHLLPTTGEPASPGRAWVSLAIDHPDARLACDALRAGHFYASTGVELARLEVTRDHVTVIPSEPAVVTFVSNSVELTHQDASPTAPATIQARVVTGKYVRAVITAPSGTHAWTPAWAVR